MTDKPRCCIEVMERWSRMPRFIQCQRRGVIEKDGKHYCRQHDPDAEAKRRADSDARWKAQTEQRRIEWAGPRMAAALLAIANGHNDPRALAKETLGALKLDLSRLPPLPASETKDDGDQG